MKKPALKQSPEAIVLGLVSGLVTIYLIIEWRWSLVVPGLIYTAVVIGLLSVLSRPIAKRIAVAWMALGEFIGKIVGGVLLSVIFLVLLTPLATLQKLIFRSNKFKSGFQVNSKSSWILRKHVFTNKNLEELW